MCEQHNKPDADCEVCLNEVKTDQAFVVEQYGNRLEEIWELFPENRDTLIEIENRHPLTGMRILRWIPFSSELSIYLNAGREGPARASLRVTLEGLIDDYVALRINNKDVRIGITDNGFFIYDTSARSLGVKENG